MTALATVTAVLLLPTAAGATPEPRHPDRSVVRHVVRPGETATGLAVRYHAWTAELIGLNHLDSRGSLRRGQVIGIPVVLSAAHRTRRHSPTRQVFMHSITPRTRGWLHDSMTRTQVRGVVSAMARHCGVPPDLALAIAWQESGWQQRRVSSAGALGVMQVMPDTGRWMRWYAGRRLRLRDTHDNVEAGVLTLRFLRRSTRTENSAIAAYYQGLGAVREHGYFRDTRHYVRSVRAHERRLALTGRPY